MNDNGNNSVISYEPEADVVRIELAADPIDYAKEMGNVVVHFSKQNVPVYLEILEATKFRKKFARAFEQPAIAVPLGA